MSLQNVFLIRQTISSRSSLPESIKLKTNNNSVNSFSFTVSAETDDGYQYF